MVLLHTTLRKYIFHATDTWKEFLKCRKKVKSEKVKIMVNSEARINFLFLKNGQIVLNILPMQVKM